MSKKQAWSKNYNANKTGMEGIPQSQKKNRHGGGYHKVNKTGMEEGTTMSIKQAWRRVLQCQ